MSGKAKVEMVGVILIVFTFVHTILLIVLIEKVSLVPSVSRSMSLRALGRVVIICGLSCALLGGAGWARVLLGLFCTLGVVFAVIGWMALTAAGGSMFSPLGACVIALALVYLWVIYMLYMDGAVIRHFDPRGGF